MADKNQQTSGRTTIDMTKTGPMSYRDLQRLNSNSVESDMIVRGPSGTRAGLSEVGKVHYDNNPEFEDFGKSTYDSDLVNYDELSQYQDLRGERQSGFLQLGAGIIKGAILAGTTFLDGTLGLLVGATQAAIEGDWSKLWDNEFSRAMQQISDASEKFLPNYYTHDQRTQPWYENIFSANFIGDKFIKNMGFSVGAIGSGVVFGNALMATKLPQLIGALTKSVRTAQLFKSSAGAVISAINEGRVEAINNTRDWQNLKLQELDDIWRQKITEDYAPDMQALAAEYEAARKEYEATKGKVVKMGSGDNMKLMDQAMVKYQEKLAKLDSKRDALQKAQEEQFSKRKSDSTYNASVAKIAEDRAKMGNADLLMNIPILTLSNLVQFGRLYSRGFNTARRATTAPKFSYAKAARLGVKGFVSEGAEEINQRAASTIAGNYYSTDVNNFHKAALGKEEQQEVLSWANAFKEGIEETYSDIDAWEEFFIGGLTGLVGIPLGQKVRGKDGKLRSPIKIEGGIFNEINDYRKAVKRSKEVNSYLDNRLADPKFLGYVQGLSRHKFYENKKQQAVDRNDAFDFKNSDFGQLVSDIVMFDNAGRLGELESAIDAAFDTSDTNLAAIIEQTTSTQTVNGKKVRRGPFVDKNGEPLINTEEGKKEMVDSLTKQYEAMKRAIKNYRRTKNEVDAQTGGALTDDQLAEATWLSVQIDNWNERAEQMTPLAKKAIINLRDRLESIQAVAGATAAMHANAEEAIKNVGKKFDKYAMGTKRRETLEKLANMSDKKFQRVITNPENLEFVQALIDDISDFGSNIISHMDKQNAVTILSDLTKVGQGIRTYSEKLSEWLSDPSKMAADQAKAEKEVKDKERKKAKTSAAKAIASAKSVAELSKLAEEAEDQEAFQAALDKAEKEGNKVVKNHREISQYDIELKNTLNRMGVDEQTAADVMTLWNAQKEAAENLNQVSMTDTAAINNEFAFDEASGGDVEVSQKRFQNARYTLQSAMARVANGRAFKNRFSKTRKAPVETIRAKTTAKDGTVITKYGKRFGAKIGAGGLSIKKESIASTNNDKAIKVLGPDAKYEVTELREKDGKFTGRIRVSNNGLTVMANAVFNENPDNLIYFVDEPTTGQSGVATVPATRGKGPVAVPATPIGDTSAGDVIKENKEANGGVKTQRDLDRSQRGRRRYYRPAIPELHIEGSKEGDFRPFYQVVAERESGVDFSEIYEYLRESGAFDYVNAAKLKPGDTIGFMIDPTFNEHTIFLVDTRNNQIVGSLDETDASVAKFEGLSKLIEDIRNEYQASKPKWTEGDITTEVSTKDGVTTIKFNRHRSDGKIYTWGGLSIDSSRITEDSIEDKEDLSNIQLIELREMDGKYAGTIRAKSKESGTYTIFEVKFTSDPTPSTIFPATPTATPTEKFFATPKTRVSKIMIGRIPLVEEERSLADIPGVLDGTTEPIFGIIKNGVLTTNAKIDPRKVITPLDIANKEGRLYLLIPNGAGTYSPAAVRVRHFNSTEFNLNDATVAQSEVGKSILAAIDSLTKASSQEAVNAAFKALADEIYLGKGAPSEREINITWFDTKEGSGIIISRKVKEADGTYKKVTINGEERIKEKKTPIYFQSKKTSAVIDGVNMSYEQAKAAGKDLSVFGKPKSEEALKKEITEALLKLNMPLQVAANSINTPGYNQRIIGSNMLTSNLREASVLSNWFTTDYFDSEGKLQSATNPPSAPKGPSNGGTNGGTITGTKVNVGGTSYIVDLKNSIIVNERTGKRRGFTTGDQLLIDMAWAQDLNGDRTESSIMTENKIITPKGEVLDRTTGKYLTGAEAQNIKDKLAMRNRAAKIKLAEAKRVEAEIVEAQKKVDKSRTTDTSYFIMEEDGEYHPYDRVHTRIGDNWIGERTSTTNSERALTAGSEVDAVIGNFVHTNGNINISKPEHLSDAAFSTIIDRLTAIKERMDQTGEKFVGDHIMVFHKYADGTRIAGEIDILTVDKEGNFKIYDVKTSRNSFEGASSYFNKASSKQRMTTKAYYTLQVSSYQNLFESQYKAQPSTLALMPFMLEYKEDTTGAWEVRNITPQKGIKLEYNPNVPVPVEKAPKMPVGKGPVKTSTIFNNANETLITEDSQRRVIPENQFDDKSGEVGYYELDGKVYTGYVKSIGEIAGVPLYITKVRDNGFGNKFNNNSAYIVVFPNGKAIEVLNMGIEDEDSINKVIQALEANPDRIKSVAAEKTQLMGPAAPTTSTNKVAETNNKIKAANNMKASRRRRRLRAVTSEQATWNREKELKWLEKVLPQLSKEDRVKVVDGLIQVAEHGPKAWGMLSDGIVILSNVAAEGTTYHEAFHVVFNLIMSEEERIALYEEARKLYGDKDTVSLEEDMAEGFREYVLAQDERGLGRRILDFFKNLFAKITHWNQVQPSLTSYYHMINQGKYKNAKFTGEEATRLKQEEATAEIKAIKERAINDGTFMLAPNGNPTNLTERQWLQVRTKAFKEWFGDWERVAPTTKSAENLISYVTEISNRNNRFSKLAQLLLDNKNLPYNLRYFKIDNNREDIGGVTAMWHSLANLIEVLGNSVSQESIDKHLLHELIHYNTEQILQDYKDGKIADNTKEEAIKNLYNIITYAKDFIYRDFQTNKDKYIEILKRQNSNIDSGLFYAFDNQESVEIDEFISEVFTNPGFQEVLNNIPYKKSGKTIWGELKDAISSILGLDINKGSVLEEALKASSILLQNDNSVSKVVDENGEPLVVYHTGAIAIDAFKIRSKSGELLPVYTTDNRDMSSSYKMSPISPLEYTIRTIMELAAPILEDYESPLLEPLNIQFPGFSNRFKDYVKQSRGALSKEELLREFCIKEIKRTLSPERMETFYSLTHEDGQQYELFVNLRNPLIVDARGNGWNNISYKGELYSTRTLEKFAQERGHDGFIVGNVYDWGGYRVINGTSKEASPTGIVLAAFTANQVKSATDNVGTFSTTNDDIRYRVAETNEAIEKTKYDAKVTYFDAIDSEIQQELINKGWTELDFDSISQEERDNALECAGL